MTTEAAPAGPPEAPLVELEAVTKVYGTGLAATPALRGVDLVIHEGEFVAHRAPASRPA
jgi:putative ABC transport system ATP-binding protein